MANIRIKSTGDKIRNARACKLGDAMTLPAICSRYIYVYVKTLLASQGLKRSVTCSVNN